MNRRVITTLAIVFAVVALVGGWAVYHNQQTVPQKFVNQGYQTFDARQSDNTVTNHLGMSVTVVFSKNSATIIASNPITKRSYLGDTKQIKSDTETAKKIYGALTGHSKFNAKDYLKPVSVNIERVHVIQNKSSWTLKSKKLTLTFHKTSDGNWETSDGTLWFPIKKK